MNPLRVVAVVVLGCLAPSPFRAQAAEKWPEFRGPGGQGHAAAQSLPTTWSETDNVRWKTPLPGRGWSSPVIENDIFWMTAAIESPLTEAEKKQRLSGNTGDQPLTVSGKLTMYALGVEQATGKLVHNIELMREESPDPVHSLNSFASPTPVIEKGRLYCYFGTNGAACVNTHTGAVLWTNRNLRLKHENGPGSSPVVHGDLMIFHCDGSDTQYVAALHKHTGQVAWKTPRSGKLHDNPQMKKAYGTPLVVETRGQPTLVSPGADWVYGYDPASGKELWKVNYGVLGFSIVPRPVAGHGMVYICTSYMRSELLAIRLAGDGADTTPSIAWRFAKQAPQKPSPVLVGEELYLISDRGVATCLNALTGDTHWQERLGGNVSASPLYADGKLYFCDQDGVTSVVAAEKTYKLLAQNKLAGSLMASPVAVDGALYLRTDKAFYRVEAPAK